MESKNSSLAILHEPFVAGMDENLSPIMQRLWKLEGGAIYFCRSGWAHVTIDLKDYEIVENTQIVLLPGTIIRINGNSSDFTASFFGFPKEMFREACLRFEPIFFRFIKEKPCYTLKDESTVQSPNQKIPDRKTKCVIKTHINIKQNVIFGAKLKPV